MRAIAASASVIIEATIEAAETTELIAPEA
jgi:hypothetical protein